MAPFRRGMSTIIFSLARLVTLDRRAMHVAVADGLVVRDRVVHDAAVVPDDDVVQPPLVAIDDLRRRRVLEQELEDCLALGWLEANKVRRKAAIDVQRLASAFRMGAHDR